MRIRTHQNRDDEIQECRNWRVRDEVLELAFGLESGAARSAANQLDNIIMDARGIRQFSSRADFEQFNSLQNVCAVN